MQPARFAAFPLRNEKKNRVGGGIYWDEFVLGAESLSAALLGAARDPPIWHQPHAVPLRVGGLQGLGCKHPMQN